MSLSTGEQIGAVGFALMATLLLIVLWRFFRFLQDSKSCDFSTDRFKKKFAFHLFLFLSVAVELPLYSGFMLEGGYTPVAYSFHKLSSSFFLWAFSITIYDWGAVLYDIQEYKNYPFFLRSSSLFALNAVYFSIAMGNFIACLVLNNMQEILKSNIYIVGLWVQISLSFFLMCLMANAGWTLSWRIQGAAGGVDNNSLLSSIATRFRNATFRKKPNGLLLQGTDVVNDFWDALRKLNIVITTCTACIALQITLLVLNYALGYSNDENKTVGPQFFYWTAYWWLPLWGPIISLLYLNKRQAKSPIAAAADDARRKMFATTSSDDHSAASSSAQETALHRQWSGSGKLSSVLVVDDCESGDGHSSGRVYTNSRGSVGTAGSGHYSFNMDNGRHTHSAELGSDTCEENEADVLSKWHYST